MDAKTDPRKLFPDQTEKTKVGTVQGQIIIQGVDTEFNKLRVFPPSTLKYPDLKYDPDFYNKIECPQLRLKYDLSKKEQEFLAMTG